MSAMKTSMAFSKRCAWAVLALALPLTVGCSSEDSETPEEKVVAPEGTPPLLGQDCDPIAPTQCGLPFPSDVYLVDDDSTPSGKRVAFGETTLPKEGSGLRHVSPDLLSGFDGFSTGQGPMTHLPFATFDGLPRPDSIASSLTTDSPTILMEAETGELIPHFVDIDQSHDDDEMRIFMLRPVVALKDTTRYIVAIRDVKNRDGEVIEPSEAFVALRDGKSSDEIAVKLRRDHYADIFSRLEGAGIPKDNLQIAWDYTTKSKENTTAQLLAMRDDALAVTGDMGPTFTVKEVEEAPNDNTLRRIIVTMEVPLYLNTADKYDPDEPVPELNLGADGLPVQNGTMTQDVLIVVPKSVETGGEHGLLQNGHGLFGSKFEGQGGYLAEMANRHEWIAFATDWYGFASEDVALALNALSAEPGLITSFVARQIQGHVNMLQAMRMMMGRVATDGIRDDQGNLLLDPAWVDEDTRAYRGDSQGGIMGAVYMAISTDVTRGLLGESGMPYNLLLNRSSNWPGYQFLLELNNNPLEVQIMMGLIQMWWDRSEPNGWVPYLNGDLPNTPDHTVLLHNAIGDHQVPTYGAHIIARTVGAKNIRSATGELARDVWGIEAADPPYEGSAMVEYEFGLNEPLENIAPSEGCDPHDRVRKLTPSYEQSDVFFRTGRVEWFCDGVCNCDADGSEEGCGTCNE